MEIRDILVVFRNVFLKGFFIGFIFLVIATLVYMPCKCMLANIYMTGFGIRPDVYYNLWVGFIGLIKTILIFLFLTPALALHWTIRGCDKK